MRRNNNSLGWFLLGLGQQWQLIASLSFSEAYVFIAGPLLATQEFPHMRKNGIMPLFWLSICLVGGCVVSCLANHSHPQAILRGMAVVCSFPCSIVVCSRMLRKNMNGFKWFFLGGAISMLSCTYIFQHSVEVNMLAGGATGSDAVESIMAGPIFWITRLKPFVTLPAKGWYLQCPLWYSIGAPLFMAFFSLLTTVSGRSSALSALAASIMVLIGGKTQSRMRRVCRNFWVVIGMAVVGIFVANASYRIAATNGWLGEEAYQKYLKQTQEGTGVLKLLMGGRMDSFCGLLACRDRPIVGYGPWAMDTHGYVAEFLQKYGSEEDFLFYIKMQERGEKLHVIPCHSFITQFWVWYGIVGLIFWCYFIFLLMRYIRQDCYAVPQMYMWLAAGIPGFLWNVFFSPLSERIGPIMLGVACLTVRAVRRGRLQLPVEMVREIIKAERK